MTDRAQLAALGAQTSGGDWPADLGPPLRCGTLGAHVEHPALAEGGYFAPIGDDPTTPGPAGHCRREGYGLYSIHWFDRYGDFMHSHPVALGPVSKGYQRIHDPRPLAPRPSDPPSTLDTAHQALCDLVIEEGAQTPAEVKDACAFLGALSAAGIPWPPTASQAEQARDRVALTRRGPRQHVEQPAPIPGVGDVWQEVIDGLDLDDPIRPICIARRALGMANYGTPLQRGNGRDEVRDTDEELADALVYAQAEGDFETVEDCKRIMRRRLRRREGR